jgi:hypothetical protein
MYPCDILKSKVAGSKSEASTMNLTQFIQQVVGSDESSRPAGGQSVLLGVRGSVRKFDLASVLYGSGSGR